MTGRSAIELQCLQSSVATPNLHRREYASPCLMLPTRGLKHEVWSPYFVPISRTLGLDEPHKRKGSSQTFFCRCRELANPGSIGNAASTIHFLRTRPLIPPSGSAESMGQSLQYRLCNTHKQRFYSRYTTCKKLLPYRANRSEHRRATPILPIRRFRADLWTQQCRQPSPRSFRVE